MFTKKRKNISVDPWVETFFKEIGTCKRYPHGNFSRGLRIVALRLQSPDSPVGRPPKNPLRVKAELYTKNLAASPQGLR